VEAHYIKFAHGNNSRGSFFSFSNGGVISISDSTITKDSATAPTIYSFLTITGGSSLILSSVNVTNLSFGGSSSTSLINIVGTSSVTILGCNFSSITTSGSSGAVLSDAGVSVDKAVNLLINGSLFTGISTSSSSTGIVITVTGGSGTNVVIHNCNFSSGISTSSSGSTLGGAIYVGNSSVIEIDGSRFSSIENVTSGGGIYVANGVSILIAGCTFNNITVKTSGGVIIRFRNIFMFLLFFFHILIIWDYLISGGVWFGGGGTFSIVYCTFSNLVAGNLTNETSPATYGGAIYSEVNGTSGLRYLTDITFINNTVVGSRG
jgi:hypothetical protein